MNAHDKIELFLIVVVVGYFFGSLIAMSLGC